MRFSLVFLIPIVAIVMGLGTGMLAMYLNYLKRKEMFALYHQQRMAAIEKGIDLPSLPEDFFREDIQPFRRSPHRSLLRGLVLVFIGLTLYPALYFTGVHNDNNGDVALYALIPIGIGCAHLIYYFAVGRKLASAVEDERKEKLARTAVP